MPKIWQGGASGESSSRLNRLMVDDDIRIDEYLERYEVLVLMAYHREIHGRGLISPKESSGIAASLIKLLENPVKLQPDLEDVHGNVEEFVLKDAGEAGKNLRIFLSRNEQSHTDIFLFLNDHLLQMARLCSSLARTIVMKRDSISGIMPGYTHYRQAMAISAVTYFDFMAAQFEYLARDLVERASRMKILPFGYGSGFGQLTDIDFNKVASYLGFEHPRLNPMFLASRRGMDEAEFLMAGAEIMATLSRVSQDLIMFSGDDLPLFTLPDGFTTGSSLMPNKKNPDFLEMVQGYAALHFGDLQSTLGILLNKSSGYHRDFQISKLLAVNSALLLEEILARMVELFQGIRFNPESSSSAIDNSSYATANSLVSFRKGLAWKDAYLEVGRKIRKQEKLVEIDPVEIRSVAVKDLDKLDEGIRSAQERREGLISDLVSAMKQIASATS